MICTLTARRLKPGAGDEFVAAFEASASEVDERWTRVYACRDVADENVILTFGFFDGTLDELRQIQARYREEASAAGAFQTSPLIDSVLLDGSFEVLKEITR